MNRTEGALKLCSDYMKQGARIYPNRDAFIFRSQHISYKDFEKNTEILSRYLLKIGVQKGDRIAYLMTTRPEFFNLYMAASQIGAIIVGMNTRFTPSEMEYVLKNSKANYIFTIANLGEVDYQDHLSQILPSCPFIKQIIVVEGVPKLPDSVAFDEIIKNDYSNYESLLREREANNSADDGLLIVYTSGSTGVPKGAVQSNRNIIHMSLVEADELGFAEPDSVTIDYAPTNHVSGANLVGMAALVANIPIVCLEMYHPVHTLQLIQSERVTCRGAVPTMLAMELALPNYDDFDLSSMRVVCNSGAPAQQALIEQVQARMCKDVRNLMGMTEACGEICYTPKGATTEQISKTVGKIAPEFEMMIVDHDRKPVPDGETGEVAYRGSLIVKEYFGMPEATAESIDESGWFYSGDLGRVRETDGFLEIVGRVKDMYISGGYNVYPVEVESAIMRYSGVLTVACVGVPHRIMGEVGRAYVIPKPGYTLVGEEIEKFLKQYLADYKIPRDYIFSDTLPMTPLGKIEKQVLRREVEVEFASKQ